VYYSIYNTVGYFYGEDVKEKYGIGKVHINDLVFAYHALALVIVQNV